MNYKNREQSLYAKVVAKRIYLLIFMSIILVLLMGYAITIGVATISMREAYGVIINKVPGINIADYTSFIEGIVLNIRLPRIFLGLIAGLSLGASGTVMQSILRNPLASPYTLGISSGSALGAGIAIILGNLVFSADIMAQHGSWIIVIGAFGMGLFTILLINVISSLKQGGAATLILAGVALSYLFSAGISLLKYISDHDKLYELTVWLMGGLHRADWLDIIILTPIIIICFIILIILAWDINTLNAGEDVASNLGINVKYLRKKGSIVVALMASSIIAFTGVIGFVGLVAPHICRMLFGNDNRFLIVGSGLMGAIILIAADTISRILISPTELPVGIITSVFGAPFFLYMLMRRKEEYF